MWLRTQIETYSFNEEDLKGLGVSLEDWLRLTDDEQTTKLEITRSLRGG